MKKLFIALALAGLGLASLGAQAQDTAETIKKAVESKLNLKVSSVTKAPLLGLYEVYADGQIIYTDEGVTAFMVGSLMDGKTLRNLTGERMFSFLPLDQAVKQVRGNGKRTLVTFEDPNCGYCKKLAKDLQGLKDTTIYTFLVPILSEDSMVKTKAIWCSADRAKAWNEWMVDGKAPTAKGDCSTPTDKNLELLQGLRINGTPAIFFADGDRMPGAVPLARIEQKLSQIGTK